MGDKAAGFLYYAGITLYVAGSSSWIGANIDQPLATVAIIGNTIIGALALLLIVEPLRREHADKP